MQSDQLDIVEFIRIIIVNLWLIIPIAVLGTVATYFVVDAQTPIYESRASVAILPNLDQDAIPRPIDDIDIAVGTYLEVLRSTRMEESVNEVLAASYDEEMLSDIEVDVRPVENSSIIGVTTRSANRELTRDYALEMARQVTEENPLPLFALSYGADILDTPQLPENPILPNVQQSLVLGAIGSLGIGVMLGFLRHTYIVIRRRQSDSVLDQASTE